MRQPLAKKKGEHIQKPMSTLLEFSGPLCVDMVTLRVAFLASSFSKQMFFLMMGFDLFSQKLEELHLQDTSALLFRMFGGRGRLLIILSNATLLSQTKELSRHIVLGIVRGRGREEIETGVGFCLELLQ